MADFGYDVADYTDIHPMFGDMDTFDRLVEEVHHHGLRIIIDLVPNHSSDQHPWFIESRSSRTNPKEIGRCGPMRKGMVHHPTTG
jgi:glycosidase